MEAYEEILLFTYDLPKRLILCSSMFFLKNWRTMQCGEYPLRLLKSYLESRKHLVDWKFKIEKVKFDLTPIWLTADKISLFVDGTF